MAALTLILRPHRERGGYHLDRFRAYLDGAHIITSRQPLYDGARELLKLGHSPDTLLTIRHVGKDHDSFVPQPIGWLALWTIADRDKDGLKRERWRYPPTPQQRALTPEKAPRTREAAA